MKTLFGLLSLLVVLGIVGFLAKKQLPSPSASAPQPPPQQVQQQVKQQVEAVLQQSRPVEDTRQ